jgi:hypothetical protein
MTRRTRFLVTAMVAGVLLIAACEAGLVEIRLQRSLTTTTSMKEIDGQAKLAAAGLRIDYLADDARHVRLLSHGDAERIDVTARLTRYDLSGATWTPLFKRARVEFTVAITSSDPDVAGTIHGTIEGQSLGILSTHDFRESFRAGVRTLVFEAFEP